jgi:hypothetical protein
MESSFRNYKFRVLIRRRKDGTVDWSEASVSADHLNALEEGVMELRQRMNNLITKINREVGK